MIGGLGEWDFSNLLSLLGVSEFWRMGEFAESLLNSESPNLPVARVTINVILIYILVRSVGGWIVTLLTLFTHPPTTIAPKLEFEIRC